MVLKIDRMEIDDAGANPKKLAEAIVKQLPPGIRAIPVREIAAAIDIYEIREAMLDGLEGGLIVPENKANGAILVHADRHETRKRYTIAHEIGHYVTPTHRSSSPDGFRCSRKDMNMESPKAGDRHAKMEAEANQFAAELLMPDGLVTAFLRRKLGADLEHILAMADWFEVSKEAAARRYVERLDVPAAIVFSCNGLIRYIKPNSSFPRLSLWNGAAVPADCLSATSRSEIGRVTETVETPGHHWLEKSAGLSLGEQTVAQKKGYRMTLLTVEPVDADETEWDVPRFR